VSQLVTILAVIAVVAYVIGGQLIGEPLRGRRVILLPVILTVVGVAGVGGKGRHLAVADIVCLVVGGLVVVAIGLAQGKALRLSSRDGSLWAQMPLNGLWLWLALISSRVLMTLVALGLDAKVAAASTTIVLMLGINRLAQAAAVVFRARVAGIPFAPEKDGRVLFAGLSSEWSVLTRSTPASPDQ
jgi:hypothetical protein